MTPFIDCICLLICLFTLACNIQGEPKVKVSVIQLWPRGLQSARLLCPWDSPGKNTGVGSPSPGDLPHPGIEPRSPALQADSLPSEPPGKPKGEQRACFIHLCIFTVLGPLFSGHVTNTYETHVNEWANEQIYKWWCNDVFTVQGMRVVIKKDTKGASSEYRPQCKFFMGFVQWFA